MSQTNQTATSQSKSKASDKYSVSAAEFDASVTAIAKQLGPVTRDQLNTRLLAAAEIHAVLDELEETLDRQIYPEQVKEDFDAPDDREYTVSITAKQWRAIGRALTKAGAK